MPRDFKQALSEFQGLLKVKSESTNLRELQIIAILTNQLQDSYG